jgi:hypothetical protein
MGYTHYWHQNDDFTDNEWSEIKKVFNQLHTLWGEDLRGGLGEGHPECTDEVVRFNGVRALWFDHETFSLNKKAPESGFGCCKTNRKPYDIVVVTLLAHVDQIISDRKRFRISSDGGDEVFTQALDR